MDQVATGAMAMGYAVAGLFFLRFWRDARDRLFGLFALAFGSGWLEQNRGAAVVVAPAVTLRDKHGKPTDAPEVPEAALLELGEAKDGEILVRWGSYEGWVERGSVRPLAQ